MCGLAGVLYHDPTRVADPLVLDRMARTLRHRGPDGQGIWQAPGVALVHRRLAIIDVEGGQQPMANEDGSVIAVFNGEIYNFRLLRRRLAASGHRFSTDSDTEVLVHLYEERGESLVDELRGMFAFAIWDARRRRLLLGRDRVGIKPLYLYRDDEKIVFGSELKAILAHPEIARTVDPAALEQYLAFGMVPGRRSIFIGFEKLPAAHTLALTHGALRGAPRRYWQLHFEPDARLTVDEWQDAIRDKIAESVHLHLVSDVPVGAFLSGGVDSSVIVTIAASQVQSLQTYSIGFAEERFNELPYARAVSHRVGTRHADEIATPRAAELVDQLTHHYDEPFGCPSAVPTWLVSRLASRGVKVVLSGDGGDEAFGGYPRYIHEAREDAIRRLLPASFRASLLAPMARFWPRADWLPRPLRYKSLLTNLSLDPAPAYANSLSLCRPPLRRALLAPDMAGRLDGRNPGSTFVRSYLRAASAGTLAAMTAADVDVKLPDEYLVKVDRASMAHGLEVRPPLLDHELLELTARIPARLKTHRGTTKWLFKEAYRRELPPDVTRRPKRGFEMPVNAWLRGPLRDMFESAVLDRQSVVAGLINQAVAADLYRAHLRGTSRHGNVLWTLLVLARWSNRYLTASASP